MRDNAIGDRELIDRHLPLVCRRLQQHHARYRAAAAHVVLRDADTAAAAGAHLAPDALAREVLARGDLVDADLLPVALELLGHELEQAGMRALAHLRARDADHAGVVGIDHDPGVYFCSLKNIFLVGGKSKWHMKTNREPASHD